MPLQLTHLERCIISALVYSVCFLLEIGGCIVLYQVISSDCVWGRENSTRIFFALICVVVPILPDILYCIMGILISDPFYAPLGGCYNIVMSCFCILSAIFAFVSYTGCGNPAQLQALVAGVLSLLAGIIHLVFILFVKENLDEGEVLFRKTF
ncbi:PREDICTED: uncharacterized protein LOC108380546 [Rhagoletis zephyria]|uniref:uncharacterized protein LOC108380546 n=1 Tax=Rhagoletis zephyria TaxID=28612 RepID=UPI0008116563|nr:PREDICTED: uncharacterized protein LOC108380546 [Rhagoletis zephyria]